MQRPLPSVDVVDMREDSSPGTTASSPVSWYAGWRNACRAASRAMLFLKPTRVLHLRVVPGLRHRDPVPQLRHLHDLPQGGKPAAVPFLRRQRAHPAPVPDLRQAVYQVFRHRQPNRWRSSCTGSFPTCGRFAWTQTPCAKRARHEALLAAFSKGEAQVLIGTQMIAKGHDFPNVTLVGVVAADATLCIPGLPQHGAHVPAADAGLGPCGTGRVSGARGRADLHAQPPRHPVCQGAGLRGILPL